ncbi:MAG: response regulator [Lachnospiraceae bacterium]
MKMILVDDEMWSMERFEEECVDLPDIEIVGKFSKAKEALSYAKENVVDFALLDIEMPEMSGIELGRELKKINPSVIIIFATAYSEYIAEAILEIGADYYILKPYSKEDADKVLQRARLLSHAQQKRVYFHTFGRFDMFVDEKLVSFTNAKAKELLALCVDRLGGNVSMEEAIDKLWEDRSYDRNVKSLYRKAIIYLNSLFKSLNLTGVFENGRGYCHINRQLVSCDYYSYLEHDRAAINAFQEEYLFDYSWGEETLVKLLDI